MSYLFGGNLSEADVVAVRDTLCAEFQTTSVDGIYLMRHGYGSADMNVFAKYGATPITFTDHEALSLIKAALTGGAFSDVMLMFRSKLPAHLSDAIEEACDARNWALLETLLSPLEERHQLERIMLIGNQSVTVSLGDQDDAAFIHGTGESMLLPAIRIANGCVAGHQ